MNRTLAVSSIILIIGASACKGSDSPGAGGSGAGHSTGAYVESAGSGNAPPRPEPGSCGIDDPAFCDTFTTASPGGRGGDLDETAWSTARVTNGVNPSQGEVFDWPPTTLSACGEKTPGVMPGKDLSICTNPETGRTQLNDSFDDNGAPALHSIRVRQPFDFKDRTGTIVVDIDAKEQTPGGHGWWWELVISEDPSPAPYQDLVSHFLYARKALVLEFQGFDCTGGDGLQNQLNRVVIEDGYQIVKDYVYEDIHNQLCFATKEEVLNHIAVHVSQDHVDVWASDLDDMGTFKLVAQVDGLDLPFTRGYVNLQHSHYNATKGGLDGFTTFHIGAVGFDGPSLARPRGYEVADAMTPAGNSPADHVNLGYVLREGEGVGTCCDWSDVPNFTFHGVDLTDAVAARISLNTLEFVDGKAIQYRFNQGMWRTFDHPFPDSENGTRSVTIPTDVADLVSGDNYLEMKSQGGEISIANIELEVVPQ